MIGLVSSLLLAAGTAHADTTTFTGNGSSFGDWNVPSNWDNGIPGADDRAVIPSGKTCTVDITNAVADTIDVLGTLIIDNNKKLTLDNGDDNTRTDPDHSEVNGNGKVVLKGFDSILKFDLNDHEVIGNGSIEGEDENAKIEIAADVVFTNRLGTDTEGVGEIHHRLRIVGLTGGTKNGTFNNGGTVRAHTGTILLHADTILDDNDRTNTPKWKATSRGTLKFNRAATRVIGDFAFVAGFALDGGWWRLRVPVRGCGW